MVLSSDPQNKHSSELLLFLQNKFALSDNALRLGIRQSEIEQAPLPVVLWSYGLLTIDQYQTVLEWQKNN